MDALLNRLSPSRRPDLSRPPGPRGGVGYLTSQLGFSRDQIGFLRQMVARHGDWSNFRLGTFDTYLTVDPDAVEQILVKKHSCFQKDALTHELDMLLGNGLLTSEGEFWKRQRRLAAPALRRSHIQSYADIMVGYTGQMLGGWSDGEVGSLHKDMTELTLKIAVQTLFNLEMESAIDEVADALDEAMHFFHLMAHTLWRFVPDVLSLPHHKRFDRAVQKLDEVIYGLIDQRRASAEPGDDLLWQLLEAVDDEGNQMTDRQLRDEVITLFLAGHETTALTLTYTWYLLSHHPHVLERLQDEVDAVLVDSRGRARAATADDYQDLPYTRAVIEESMRLYPPAWIIGREAVADIEIGGWTIPRGAQVLMPQCVMHRDARWFDRPDDFVPDRWLGGELADRLPRFAYFPFGGGARICIGNHFAMMEAILVVATIAQQFSLVDRSPEPLRTQPSVTLRPATPIEMEVVGRTAKS